MNLLENNQIRLRAPEPEDLQLLYQWENDTDIWLISNTLTPFSRHVLKQFIDSSIQDIYQLKQQRFMIDMKTEVVKFKTIGTIDLFDFDPFHKRAGIGILISDKQERNKGYASQTLEILIKYSSEILQLHQLYCNITVDNELSLKLFEKHGFKIVGEKKDWINKGNDWIGEYFLQLLLKS